MATPTPPQLSYTPSAEEQPYYELLFKEADQSRCGSISGVEAVSFLSRSKLPIPLLKNIWLMADNPRTNYLDQPKFFVAVRLIQLYQNGRKANGVDLGGEGMRPPFFEGIAMQPVQQSQLETFTALTPVNDAYYMSPSDQSRYEALFPTYQKDGYIYGAEAVALFSRSGLSNEQLRDIWNLSDDPVDNRLSKLEFSIAMHLIVCVSRKGLDLPGVMPASLAKLKSPPVYLPPAPQPQYPTEPYVQQQYSIREPAPVTYTQYTIPNTSSYSQPDYQAPTQYTIPNTSSHSQPDYQAPMPEAPPSPSRSVDTSYSIGKPPLAPMSKMSITDAFSNLSTEPQDTYSISSVPPSPSRQETNPTSPQVNKPPEIPKLEKSDNEELQNLQKILQQMRAENISLKAQLNTYSTDEKDIKDEITRTISEISSLSKELTSLRTQVSQANASLVEATSQLKIHQEKKSSLQDLIASEQSTLRALEESEGVVKEVLETQIQISNVNEGRYTNYEVDFLGFIDVPPPPPMDPPPEPVQTYDYGQQMISYELPQQQQTEQPQQYQLPMPQEPQESQPQYSEPQESQPQYSEPPPVQYQQPYQPQPTYETQTIDPQHFANLELLKSALTTAKQEEQEAKAEYSRVKIKSEQIKQEAEEAQQQYAASQSQKKSLFKKKNKSVLEKTQKEADALGKKYLEVKLHVEEAMGQVGIKGKKVEELMEQIEALEVEIATAESCRENENHNF